MKYKNYYKCTVCGDEWQLVSDMPMASMCCNRTCYPGCVVKVDIPDFLRYVKLENTDMLDFLNDTKLEIENPCHYCGREVEYVCNLCAQPICKDCVNWEYMEKNQIDSIICRECSQLFNDCRKED